MSGQTVDNSLSAGTTNEGPRGGAGHDVLTSGSGADTFRFAAGDSPMGNADVIANYQSSGPDADRIHFDGGPAGTAENFMWLGFMNAPQTDEEAAAQMQGPTDKAYMLVQGPGKSWLFADTDGDHRFDSQVSLEGVTIQNFDYHSII